VLTRDHANTALLGLSPDGLPLWRRTARTPWRRAAPLTQDGFLVAGTVDDASADSAVRHTFQVAHLSAAGEVEWQESVRLTGWSEVAGLWPAFAGSMFLVAGDRAYGEGRHRKALLVRLAAGGRVQWTREVFGWGAVSLPGVVPLADNGVVVLADAVHCLDPGADTGCDGDAMCDWNSAHARCGWNKSLTRYAANGHRVWHRPLKLEGRPSNLVAVEGGYLFAVVSPGAVELLQLNEEGQVSWQKTSEAPIAAIVEGGHALRVHGDRVVLVGVTTRGDVLVLEHGRDGELLAQHRFGGRGRDVGHTSFARGDGMLVLADSDSADLPGAAAEEPYSLYVIPMADR
jgi:outer membrane protein assembly factor BamB